jgi:hypothetical protein
MRNWYGDTSTRFMSHLPWPQVATHAGKRYTSGQRGRYGARTTLMQPSCFFWKIS